jgi:hypothetical protein
MTTVKNIMKRLAQGQLKNTSAVEDAQSGEICEEYKDVVIGLLNQGLTDISSRMPIITQYVDLTFVPGQNVYPLVSGAAYLDDSGLSPFTGDFVRVLDVFDAEGRTHDVDTNGHIMTPSYDTLRFTSAKMTELGQKVRIRYQAKHPEVGETDVIKIPPNLEAALQLFVASLYISHMNGQEHSQKGDAYFGAYLRHMGEDETRNTSNVSEVQEDTRFEDRGFA